MVSTGANHNKGSGTNKSQRRELLIQRIKEVVADPKVGLFFPARDGHDVGELHAEFPNTKVIGVEHSEAVMRLQRTAPNLTDKSKAPVIVYLTSFGGLLNGGILKRIKAGYNHFSKITLKELNALNETKFDCGYIDYVRPTSDQTIEEVRQFLKERTAPRYVIGVTNLIVDVNDQFGDYEEVAKTLGVEFERLDYEDSAKMGFGMFIRR